MRVAALASCGLRRALSSTARTTLATLACGGMIERSLPPRGGPEEAVHRPDHRARPSAFAVATLCVVVVALSCGRADAGKGKGKDGHGNKRKGDKVERTIQPVRLDPKVRGHLGPWTEMRYSDGADPAEDRPGHVRAASAVRQFGARLAIAQDDANFIALRAPDGSTTGVPLPRGPGGRRLFGSSIGNKNDKMDIEAAVVLPDGRFVGFGSGSKEARRRLVIIAPSLAVRVFDAAALYEALVQRRDFAGGELNIEGAVVVGRTLRLFQRGNGATVAGVQALDATIDLDLAAFTAWIDGKGPMPALGVSARFDLGAAGGVRMTFTDAAALPDGRVVFLASAEASPDTVQDGAVTGCRVGLIDAHGATAFDVVDAAGGLCRTKLEGIEPIGVDGQTLRFVVVADVDDEAAPALTAELRVVLPATAPPQP